MPVPSAPRRGELIDIGGRRLRAVRAGPASAAPLVVFECGAFGCAADWAVVQARLAAKGLASLAYDRAGLGFSDPGPEPRDGQAITQDLEQLLTQLGSQGPLLLVGHSMAGQLLPIFIGRNRDRVRGLVLVDAMSADAVDVPAVHRMIEGYRRAMNLVGRWSHLGFMGPVSLVAGNLIGLEGEASKEKRQIYGMASHARGAALEVRSWFETAEQARVTGAYNSSLPIAVVSAGQTRLPRSLKALQAAPAEASEHGIVADVKGANHASLLGRRHADAIVECISHVLKHI